MTYRPFVIISYLRSGTHLLRTALESHPAIVCQTEVFNSDSSNLPYPLNTNTKTILDDWVYKSFASSIQQVGFVLQAYHPFALQAFPGIRENLAWSNIWPILSNMQGLKVIHLRRENLLRRHLSHVQARKTGQWHAWDAERVKSVTHFEVNAIARANSTVVRDKQVTLNAEQLKADFIEVDVWHKRAEQQLSHHSSVSITYEQLCSDFDSTTHFILRFLSVEQHSLQAAVKKLEQRSLRDSIVNYDDLKAYFIDTEWALFFEE